MKKLLMTLGILLSNFAHASSVEIGHVFIPSGFDDNDNVQVVIAGTLPSTCWRVSETKVLRQESEITLKVAAVEVPKICLPIAVPFYKVIDLGSLPSGHYSVHAANQKEAYALNVARATSSNRDEILYANVVSSYLRGHTLTIKGVHPDPSFSIKGFDIYESDNVVVVLPVADSVSTISNFVTVPFEKSVDLSSYLNKSGVYLIHVRSMNGNSLNLVENVSE